MSELHPTLFVGDLPPHTTAQALGESLEEKLGCKLFKVTIPGNARKSLAFVAFENEEDATRALDEKPEFEGVTPRYERANPERRRGSGRA